MAEVDIPTNESVPLMLEVELKREIKNDVSIEIIRERVRNFFRERTFSLTDYKVTSQELTPDLVPFVETISVTYPHGIGKEPPPFYFWWDVSVQIFVFQCHDEGPREATGDQENGSFYREWQLPCVEFRGIWDHLHFDDDLKTRLLGYVETGLLFSQKGVSHDIINWNRLMLLHGPPGTGKTSLCKALAQKLSIILHNKYSNGVRFVEINAHSLFSKYYSESSKLIGRLFESIRLKLHQDVTLLFVLIDEVESVTAARKAAISSSEPSDAVRAVNALLTELDRLQYSSSVVVMTTTNISEAIDDAFLDRADIKAFVGPPGANVRYRILHSCVEELQRVGLVLDEVESADGVGRDKEAMKLLWECVRMTDGCSCRFLKKIPFIACVRCRSQTAISVETVLQEIQRLCSTDTREDIAKTDI